MSLNGGAPRIDAYSSLLAIPGAAKDPRRRQRRLMDGNRRVIRDQGGVETPDSTAARPRCDPLHSTPDGVIDMQDFRRFRDAVLQSCSDAIVNTPGSRLPERDARRCRQPPEEGPQLRRVRGRSGRPNCSSLESSFSRFDFNGDGTLDPGRPPGLPLHGNTPTGSLAAGDLDTDLGVRCRRRSRTTPT